MPIWARFRCSASVYHLLTRRTSKNAYLGMVSMLGICPPFFTRRTSKKCPDGHGFDAWHLSTTSPAETSKNCPSGHIFDALRVSTTSPPPEHRNRAHLDTVSMLGARPPFLHPPNIEKMPRWAWFRCSAFIHYPVHHIPTCRTSKKCPDRHGFDVWDGRQILNIKTMPTWACFRCSACVHHLLTRRASKLCPDGRNFDARRASTTSLPAGHRSHAQMHMFSMFGVSPPPPHLPNLKTIAIWARF